MFLSGLSHRYKNQFDFGYVPLWLPLPAYLIDQRVKKCVDGKWPHLYLNEMNYMWFSSFTLFNSLCGC